MKGHELFSKLLFGGRLNILVLSALLTFSSVGLVQAELSLGSVVVEADGLFGEARASGVESDLGFGDTLMKSVSGEDWAEDSGDDPQPVVPGSIKAGDFGVTPGALGVNGQGEATYELPLAVSLGVGGVQPGLSLVYRSGGGNGLLGMGFSLTGGSSIDRGNKHLREDGVRSGLNFTQGDALYLDGQRLHAVSGESGGSGSEYRTKQRNFVKVLGQGAIQSMDSGFVVHRPDGSRWYYGTSADSRVWVTQKDDVAAAGEGLVYRWALKRVEDRHGNGMTYEYAYDEEDGNVQGHRLSRIVYTDNGPMGLAAQREVRFEYREREDIVEGYFAGRKLRNKYLLDLVEVWGPRGLSDQKGIGETSLLRIYHLTYDRPTITGRSLLKEVVECTGKDGGIGACKNPTKFRYELGELDFEKDTEGHFSFSGVPYPRGFKEDWSGSAFTGKTSLLSEISGDFTGDGLTDLLVASQYEAKHWALWEGRSSIELNSYAPLYLKDQPSDLLAPFSDAFDGVNINASTVNNNNDHMSDVLYRYDPLYAGYFNETPLEPHYVIMEATGMASKPFERKRLWGGDKIFLTGDYNGDGLADLVFCQRPTSIFGATDSRYFEAAEHEKSRTFAYVLNNGIGIDLNNAVSTGIACSDRDLYVQMDVDGDGAQDILMVLGVNNVGAPVTTAGWGENYQRIRFDFVQQQASLEDSGLPVDRYQRWRHRSGNSACHDVLQVNHQLGMDRIADFNGDGLLDVVRMELPEGDSQVWMDAIKSYQPCIPPEVDKICKEKYDDYAGYQQCLVNAGYGAPSNENAVLRLYENTGQGFNEGVVIKTFTHPGALMSSWQYSTTLDLRAMGKPGVLYPLGVNPQNWYWLGKTAKGQWEEFEVLSGIPTITRSMPMPMLDANGDGLHDIVIKHEDHWGVYPHKGGVPDLLVEVRDGQGNRDGVVYEAEQLQLRKQEVQLPAGVDEGAALEYPRYRSASVRPVVVQSTQDNGGGKRAYTYRYYQPVSDRLGAGNLGYRAREVHEIINQDEENPGLWDQAGERHVYEVGDSYDAQIKAYPYAGKLLSSWNYARYKSSEGQSRIRVNSQELAHMHQVLQDGSYTSFAKESRHRLDEVSSWKCDGALWCDKSVLEKNTPETASYWRVTQTDNWGRITGVKSGDAGEEYFNEPSLSVMTQRVEYADKPNVWVWGLITETEETNSVPFDGSETRRMRYVYGDDGSLKSAIRAPGEVDFELKQTYAYDGYGNVLEVVTQSLSDKAGKKVKIVYDEEGLYVREVINPLGYVERYGYDRGLGYLGRVKDVTGLTSYGIYDDWGFLRASYNVGGGKVLGPVVYMDYEQINLGVDQEGLPLWGVRLKQHGAGIGSSTQETDRYGRLLKTQSSAPLGKQIQGTVTYDSRGRLRESWLPSFSGEASQGKTRYSYNALDELVKIEHPNGSETNYYRSGLISGVKDGDGRWTIEEQDRLGRPMLTKGPFACNKKGLSCLALGEDEAEIPTMLYQYTTFSNVRSVAPLLADSKMPPVFVVSDKYGNRLQLQDKATGVRKSSYDAYGQLIEETDALGSKKTYSYDVVGRLVEIGHDSGVDRFFYDGQYAGLQDGSQSSAGHRQSIYYDVQRRPYRHDYEVMAEGQTELFSYRYVYDGFNRLHEIHYPEVSELPKIGARYHYDGLGNAVRVTSTLTDKLYWELKDINASGRITASRLGNGVEQTTSYDPQTGLIASIKAGDGQDVFQRLNYSFSPGGDLLLKEDQLLGQSEAFSYDPVGRLKQAVAVYGNKKRDELYTYDAFGNFKERSEVGFYTYTGPHLAGISGKVGNIRYNYDANGNMESRVDGSGVTEFYYTPFERIDRVKTKEGIVSYEYDADGNRVRRLDFINNKITTSIGGLYERESSALLNDMSANHRYRLMSPDGLIGEIELKQDAVGNFAEVNEYYMLKDHLGSVDVVLNQDKAVVDRMSFDSYGMHRNPEDWTEVYGLDYEKKLSVDLGFTGHRGKRDGGVVDMQARLYDPLAGRFISADPMISNPLSSQRLNRYSYVMNRPQNLTDPSGMTPCADACEMEPERVSGDQLQTTASGVAGTGSTGQLTSSGSGSIGGASEVPKTAGVSSSETSKHLGELANRGIDSNELSAAGVPTVYGGMVGDLLGANAWAEGVDSRYLSAVDRGSAQGLHAGQPSDAFLGAANDAMIGNAEFIAMTGLTAILGNPSRAGFGATASTGGGASGGGGVRAWFRGLFDKNKGKNKNPRDKFGPHPNSYIRPIHPMYGTPIEVIKGVPHFLDTIKNAMVPFPINKPVNIAIVNGEVYFNTFYGGNQTAAAYLSMAPGVRVLQVAFNGKYEMAVILERTGYSTPGGRVYPYSNAVLNEGWMEGIYDIFSKTGIVLDKSRVPLRY